MGVIPDLRGWFRCPHCDVEPFFVQSLLDDHLRHYHPEESK